MRHHGYLTTVYRKYTNPDVQLAEFYKRGEPAVTIFGSAGLGELQAEVKDQKEILQKLVNGLTADNLELNQRLKTLEKKMDVLLNEIYEDPVLRKRLTEKLQQAS